MTTLPRPSVESPAEAGRGALPVRDAVRTVRSRIQRVLVGAGVLSVAAALVWGVLIGAGIEALLRLPVSARLALTGMIIAGVIVCVRRWLWPAVRFAPSLVSIALQIEQLHPSFRGKLASAIDLERDASSGLPGALAAVASSQASAQVRGLSIRELVSVRVLRVPTLLLTGAVSVLALSIAIAPQSTRTALERVVWPLGDSEWPSRFPISDATETARHPRGSALPIRSVLLDAPSELRGADVWVEYQLIDDRGERSSTKRELMTYQGPADRAGALDGLANPDAPLGASDGVLFERLVDTDGSALRYRVVTRDDASVWRSVPLEHRPRVVEAVALIEPPGYARALPGQVFSDSASEVALGSGDTAAAVAPPALEGSAITLRVRVNKAASLSDRADIGGVLLASSADDPTLFEASFGLIGTTRLVLDFVDAYGIASEEPSVLRFPAIPDQAPAASVIEPASDESVLPGAFIMLEGEGRDDVGLDSVALTYSIAGDPGERVLGSSEAAGARRASVTSELDLPAMGAEPGDTLLVYSVALDARTASAGLDGVRSSPRRLVVIDEDQFVQQVQRLLSEIRQSAIRADAQQAQAQAQVQESGPTRSTRRAQSQVSDRIREQRDELEMLQDRLERNQLDDERLDQLVSQAGSTLDRAAGSASRAQDAMDEAAARVPEPDMPEGLTAEERTEIEQAQQATRDELAQLVGLLDRGEDAWVVRNALQRALEQQRELRERTREIGEQTVGRDTSELTEEQQAALEEIARDQRDLAEQTDAALNQAEQRARELADSDPTASIGLREAAQTAREQGASRAMERAAQEAQQNQTANAEQAQQQAQDALEQAIEDLDAGERERDAVLRRALASVIESLQSLISQNEAVIEALNVDAPELPRVLDQIVRLNTNTIGVTELLRTGPEFQRVLSLVLSAADAQLGTGRALRASPADLDTARDGATRSLDLLRDALEMAQAVDEDLEERELERKLAELRERYTHVLEASVAMLGAATGFEDKKALSRRDRAALRSLAADADAIGDALDQIELDVPEALEAEVFAFAHRQARSETSRSATALRAASVPLGVFHAGRLVRALRELVESLRDPTPDDTPFDAGSGDGGAGGGGGGGQPGENDTSLIPALNELRLLRRLQMNLAEDTRALDAAGGAEDQLLDELGALQQQLATLGEDLVERMLDEGDLSSFFENADRVPTRRGDVAPELEDAESSDADSAEQEIGGGGS